MIKAVLFDYGGVLSEGGKVGGIPETLGTIYGINPDEIKAVDLHDKLIAGKISEKQFFDELNARYGAKATASVEMFDANNQHFITPCQVVYDLAATLRAAGIKTAILSNVYKFSAEQLRREGLYKDFEPIILSCDEGIAKPEPAFYQRALERLGLSGEEVLYVEDQERFMPPKELGVHTILATSPQQIVDDIRAVLLRENNLRIAA